MSRIGKNPINITDKVDASIANGIITVKGPKGELKYSISSKVIVAIDSGKIIVSPIDDTKESRSMWGTTRTLINNMVLGVSIGFVKALEFNGVGYKAAVNNNNLTLSLGYSHSINYELPEGITAKVNKNQIEITGVDKHLIGLVASKIRSYRPPEPYKGKGVKYSDEVIIKKAGKSGGKK